jgi:hypothetical protein
MHINQHVVRRPSGWAVIGDGNGRDTSLHRTRGEAIERGREIAKNQKSELVIHDLDGKIREKSNYRSERSPARGEDLG